MINKFRQNYKLMFLKLVLKNQVKKVILKDLKTLADLNTAVSKATGLEEGNFSLSFVDVEDERINIFDNADVEYFLATFEGKQFVTLEVTDLTKESAR